ncbi:MAG: hypothetical protein R2880_15170 [Deinococcales bacterium]
MINDDKLEASIRQHWSKSQASTKAARYLNQFFECKRFDSKITAKVHGNHGIYTVSISLTDQGLSSGCSCYIGKGGGCHHCEALALTFLQGKQPFEVIISPPLEKVSDLLGLQGYLAQTSLASLLDELRRCGMTQKALADSLGMSSRHLSSMKSSEARNRYHQELGAMKLACLWVLEHQEKWKAP